MDLNASALAQKSRSLIERAVVVDVIAPEVPGGFVGAKSAFRRFIEAYERAGVTWASLTVDTGYPSIERAIKTIAETRRFIQEQPERFVLVDKIEDVAKAKASGRLALNFNFQNTDPLAFDIHLVELYRRLGVGHMLLAYNARNFVADGCHEPSNAGLSRFGLQVVAEMNRVGMVLDVSHTGYRSSMEAIEASSAPVIFSHSNPRAVHDHERNIWDDQIKASVATGGVIGINGASLFLSDRGPDIAPGLIFKHLDYVVQLVGPRHVGLGVDYVCNLAGIKAEFDDNPGRWSASQGYDTQNYDFASPEVIPSLVELMLSAGYADEDIDLILGGNWMRVFGDVWATYQRLIST